MSPRQANLAREVPWIVFTELKRLQQGSVTVSRRNCLDKFSANEVDVDALRYTENYPCRRGTSLHHGRAMGIATVTTVGSAAP